MPLELITARRIANERLKALLEQQPIIMQDPNIETELSDASFPLAESIADLPESRQRQVIDDALNACLESPAIKQRIQKLLDAREPHVEND